MIEVNGLTKKYGTKLAVDNISFTIQKGEIVGFLGPNGAGKSTTMNMITGYISATGGVAKIAGFDVLDDPIMARRHIGYLPEQPPLYLDMTVREYLGFVYDLKKVKHKGRRKHIDEVCGLVDIEDVSGRIIGNLSKGYKQRVGLAQALIGDPDVLILDEPTVGLDPNQIIEIRDMIKNLGKKRTIILSTHILPEVHAVCERVLVYQPGCDRRRRFGGRVGPQGVQRQQVRRPGVRRARRGHLQTPLHRGRGRRQVPQEQRVRRL